MSRKAKSSEMPRHRSLDSNVAHLGSGPEYEKDVLYCSICDTYRPVKTLVGGKCIDTAWCLRQKAVRPIWIKSRSKS